MNFNNINIFLMFFILSSDLIFASSVEIFKDKTSIKNPLKLRDPFKSPKLRSAESVEKEITKKDGEFTNVKPLGIINVGELEIIGILIGENRRAIVKLKNGKEQFTITEGMIIGSNNAEVKAIVPGGIVIVEKIENIYGELEFLETVLPIAR